MLGAGPPASMGSSGVPGRLFRAAGGRRRKNTSPGAGERHFWRPRPPRNPPETVRDHEKRGSGARLGGAFDFGHRFERFSKRPDRENRAGVYTRHTISTKARPLSGDRFGRPGALRNGFRTRQKPLNSCSRSTSENRFICSSIL